MASGLNLTTIANVIYSNASTFLNSSIGPPACSRAASICRPGVVLPVWQPQQGLGVGDTVGRAIVYALGLAYLFLGVSIIADRFMAAIEVITSQEKEICVTDSNGNKQVVMVRYWNETVSNLTVNKVYITLIQPPCSILI